MLELPLTYCHVGAIISRMPKDKIDKDQDKKRRKPKSDKAEEEPEEEETLKPVDFKIAEGEENLKQREEWFQKRHK
jgi:hypothetical protein